MTTIVFGSAEAQAILKRDRAIAAVEAKLATEGTSIAEVHERIREIDKEVRALIRYDPLDTDEIEELMQDRDRLVDHLGPAYDRR